MHGLFWKIQQRVRSKLGLECSYALNGLDLKLLRWLNRRGGTFIECGANDGITQSNTLFYERHRGWRGLLVEPVPELATRCRKNRPNAIVEQCALVPTSERGKEINLTYCNLMTAADNAMGTEEATLAHISLGAQVQKIEPYRFTAQGVPLSDLLAKHHLNNIDLFSLDVEGAEPAVLDGLDFEQHAPRYILVETRSREAIESRLLARYELAAQLSEHDILYQRKDIV